MAGAREPTGLGTERMPSGSDGPELGAQFAQLVKELRSEYAGAVTACAARIAQGVFGPSGRSILRILEQHGITGTPTLMQQQASFLVPAPPARPTPLGSLKSAVQLIAPFSYHVPACMVCTQIINALIWVWPNHHIPLSL